MKTDNMTVSAQNIGFTGVKPHHPNVSVYKLASRFLSCRAAKFVEHKTMLRFGVETTGNAPHGNSCKISEHIAKYGEQGSPKARRVLAVLEKYKLDEIMELTPQEIMDQLPKTHFETLVGVAIVGDQIEHYGYAQVPESVAVAHYDSSHNAIPAKDVLTGEQLKDAAVYGLDPNELVWFRSCRDHGMDFKADGTLYNRF